MSILQMSEMSLSFGGLLAVQRISFDVNNGDVFSIIGPNGAGKSTLINLISRFYDADEGTLQFEGRDITAEPPHHIAELGIARTFQNIELFEHETVLQNLLIGKHVYRKTNLVSEFLFTPAVRRQEMAFRKEAEDVIDLLDLQHYRHQVIGSLPYGVRKMVELARALCVKPRLLLLDEPSSGLNPEEKEDLSYWIEDINEELGVTIIMVEHDMNLVLRSSNKVMAMADGRCLAIGLPDDIQSNPEVKRAYLGDF